MFNNNIINEIKNINNKIGTKNIIKNKKDINENINKENIKINLNNIKKITALDLSFSKTGIAKIDTEKKEIELNCLVGDGKKHQKFIEIQQSLKEYTLPELDKHIKGSNILIIEEPFPFGMFSSGLYALDTAVIQRYYEIEHYSFSPRTLEYIHNCRSHKKKQSVELVKSIIEILERNGYKIIKKSKGHDACEAFIYLIHFILLNLNIENNNMK